MAKTKRSRRRGRRPTRADLDLSILKEVLVRTSAHPRIVTVLEGLVATGLYGFTPLEALVRAAEERLRDLTVRKTPKPS